MSARGASICFFILVSFVKTYRLNLSFSLMKIYLSGSTSKPLVAPYIIDADGVYKIVEDKSDDEAHFKIGDYLKSIRKQKDQE